jgi:hypothetical protein
MKRDLTQILSAALLFVLVWSCFGLSLGMIGHDMVALDGMDHSEMSDAPECCGGTTDAQPTGMMSMNHHDVMLPTLVTTNLLFLFVIVTILLQLVLWYVPRVHQRIHSYAKKWHREIFFSLWYVRLFSNGILHAKTW